MTEYQKQLVVYLCLARIYWEKYTDLLNGGEAVEIDQHIRWFNNCLDLLPSQEEVFDILKTSAEARDIARRVLKPYRLTTLCGFRGCKEGVWVCEKAKRKAAGGHRRYPPMTPKQMGELAEDNFRWYLEVSERRRY
jgi:hypothetical protein